MSRYAKWAQGEHGEATRIATMLLVAPVFLGLLPFIVAGIGPRLDRRLGLPPLGIGRVNRILGGLLTVLGFSLGFWSVNTLMTRGRGTPLPVMPTQELLTEGPFRFCRNPMTLGAILAYLVARIIATNEKRSGSWIAERSPSRIGLILLRRDWVSSKLS